MLHGAHWVRVFGCTVRGMIEAPAVRERPSPELAGAVRLAPWIVHHGRENVGHRSCGFYFRPFLTFDLWPISMTEGTVEGGNSLR